jgi:hypothetical protein
MVKMLNYPLLSYPQAEQAGSVRATHHIAKTWTLTLEAVAANTRRRKRGHKQGGSATQARVWLGVGARHSSVRRREARDSARHDYSQCGGARRVARRSGYGGHLGSPLLLLGICWWVSGVLYLPIFFILRVLNMLLSFNISGERAWFLLLDAELLLAQCSLCI